MKVRSILVSASMVRALIDVSTIQMMPAYTLTLGTLHPLFAAPDQRGSAEHVGRVHTAPLETPVFCASHSIPHESCPTCLTTVAAMRPTIFAELAAAEMRSGTECCRGCDYVFREVVAKCPRCALVHPFYFAAHPDAARTSEVEDFLGQPVMKLHALTLRDLPAAVR